jgi:hypothetical protein
MIGVGLWVLGSMGTAPRHHSARSCRKRTPTRLAERFRWPDAFMAGAARTLLHEPRKKASRVAQEAKLVLLFLVLGILGAVGYGVYAARHAEASGTQRRPARRASSASGSRRPRRSRTMRSRTERKPCWPKQGELAGQARPETGPEADGAEWADNGAQLYGSSRAK